MVGGPGPEFQHHPQERRARGGKEKKFGLGEGSVRGSGQEGASGNDVEIKGRGRL